MKVEVTTIVRLPVTEIAALVAEKNGITVPLSGAKLDAGHLILSFANGTVGEIQSQKLVGELVDAQADLPVSEGTEDEVASPKPGRRSSKKRKRHRMKTRGWEVVATITNAYGQKACVYRPFVEALSQKGLSAAQKRSIVAKILRSNDNKPNDASIEYYLMNTLEYLDQTAKQGVSTNGA